MPPWYPRIWPWAFAALIAWAIYRRFRRTFGRQPLRPVRMRLRMTLLAVLAASLVPAALHDFRSLEAEILGALAGVALALWGASRTRFIEVSGRMNYIPHSRSGIAVSALVLARLAYRAVEIYSAGGSAMPVPGSLDGRADLAKTPLTLGLLFVLVGYYVGYYGLVLRKSRRITPADLEASAPPEGGAPDASAGQVEKGDGQQAGAGQQHIVAPTGDQT